MHISFEGSRTYFLFTCRVLYCRIYIFIKTKSQTDRSREKLISTFSFQLWTYRVNYMTLQIVIFTALSTRVNRYCDFVGSFYIHMKFKKCILSLNYFTYLFVGTLVRDKKLFLTERSEARICAKGVTMRSSPWLKIKRHYSMLHSVKLQL